VGEAVTDTPRDAGLLRRVLARVIAVTVLVEFAVNLYAFPFAIEVFLIFVVLLCGVLQAVPDAREFANHGLVAVGLVYMAYFVIRALDDPAGLLTRERVEDLLVGPALTVVLIPFLYSVAWFSGREQARLRRRWHSSRLA
jgi:hypothetical protein